MLKTYTHDYFEKWCELLESSIKKKSNGGKVLGTILSGSKMLSNKKELGFFL